MINKEKTVLICDDDEGILELVSLILEESGFRPVPVQNSLNVFRTIEEEKPDLLLLDMWMPVLSGDQVLKTMREHLSMRELPVIVISASRDGEEIARNAGASTFLAKPFDIDELVEKVNSLI